MSSNEHRVTTYNMLLPYIITVAFVIEAFFLKDKFLEHEASHESDLSSDDDFEVNYSKFKCIDCNLTFSSEDNFKVHMSLKHDRSFLNSTVDLNENENEISTNLNNESQQGVQVQTPDVDLNENDISYENQETNNCQTNENSEQDYDSEKNICNFQKNNFVKLVMDYGVLQYHNSAISDVKNNSEFITQKMFNL